MTVPIIPLVIAALAWVTGYLAVVASSFLLTFGIASTVPRFVAHAGRMKGAYLVVQAAVWTLCAAIGGGVAGTLAGTWHPSQVAALLAVALVVIHWLNAGDTALQDGVPYRLLFSALTLVGVMGGDLLSVKH